MFQANDERNLSLYVAPGIDNTTGNLNRPGRILAEYIQKVPSATVDVQLAICHGCGIGKHEAVNSKVLRLHRLLPIERLPYFRVHAGNRSHLPLIWRL